MQNFIHSRPLNAKQSRFIDEYMVDLNGAAAAERSGYSKKTSRSIACELLTKPDLQAVLRERQAALAEEIHITRQGVIQGILEGIEMARTEKLPGLIIRGYTELARMLGYFEPEVKRVKLTAGQGKMEHNLVLKSDAELLALIAAGT